MTGQGNARHEQIRADKQQQREQRAMAIDITKDLRTFCGYPVRALQFSTRPQRTFLYGKLANTGNQERCIIGQAFMPVGNSPKAWRAVTWKENGEHDINEDLNLVDAKPLPVVHTDLFGNKTSGTL